MSLQSSLVVMGAVCPTTIAVTTLMTVETTATRRVACLDRVNQTQSSLAIMDAVLQKTMCAMA